MINILFVGETWLGSCARSMKEALTALDTTIVHEISEEACYPRAQSFGLKLIHRMLKRFYRREFNRMILSKIRATRPDVFMVYKGHSVHVDLLQAMQSLGVLTVNIYPDCSPHNHGIAHREAVGKYDLVVSTKIFHPPHWDTVFGYKNQCVFVPQGYDASLHYFNQPASEFKFDVVLIATFRAEYGKLMIELGQILEEKNIRVVIGGHGWEDIREQLPNHWNFVGAVHGHAYVSLLRSAKICIAPVHVYAPSLQQNQFDDVDTTRTYELAASNCFFIHRRTAFVMQLYQGVDLPMFDSASELADKIRYFLIHDEQRKKITALAHRKAVPAYSNHARAEEIVSIIRLKIKQIQTA